MKYEVCELEGALLDAAVAECGEWKTAHARFPTMTLDPTFSGWRIVDFRNELVCLLTPSNPFRQDPKQFNPSSDWSIAGPIIERERIDLEYLGDSEDGEWRATMWWDGRPTDPPWATGDTPLIAAMRCFVLARFGDEIDLPAGEAKEG